MPGVSSNTTVGSVTAPAVHVAWFTVGATGTTGVQATASKVIVNVASVSDVSVQPCGIAAGQPTCWGSSVAVTVTVSPGA